MTVAIRQVETRDHRLWLAMRVKIYPGLDTAFHSREMTLYGGAPDKACFVAGEDNEIVGFIELSLRNVVDGCLSSPVGYVEGIYVEPRHRGRGIGGALMRHAEDWSKARGCSEMATDALIDDEQAQTFHEHVGFSETFRIVQFKRVLEQR